MPDIYRHHSRGTAFKKHLRETAGGRSSIQAPAGNGDVKLLESIVKFLASSGNKIWPLGQAQLILYGYLLSWFGRYFSVYQNS
jgi:hypothetical protein